MLILIQFLLALVKKKIVSHCWVGQIRLMKCLFGTKLSSNEAASLYNSGIALNTRTNSGNYNSSNKLIGYWKMEEASGDKLTDLSGYGNDGGTGGYGYGSGSWTAGVPSTSYDNTPLTLNQNNITVKKDGV